MVSLAAVVVGFYLQLLYPSIIAGTYTVWAPIRTSPGHKPVAFASHSQVPAMALVAWEGSAPGTAPRKGAEHGAGCAPLPLHSFGLFKSPAGASPGPQRA